MKDLEKMINDVVFVLATKLATREYMYSDDKLDRYVAVTEGHSCPSIIHSGVLDPPSLHTAIRFRRFYRV